MPIYDAVAVFGTKLQNGKFPSFVYQDPNHELPPPGVAVGGAAPKYFYFSKKYFRGGPTDRTPGVVIRDSGIKKLTKRQKS